MSQIKIEKYLNSFLNVPGQFSLIRKNINFILGKIIKNNSNKLKFNEPNIKIIKLTFGFIAKIKNNINNIIINEKGDINIKNSIIEKLAKLEEILTQYQNALNSKYKAENKKLENLEPALIKFTDKEIKFLKDNYLDIPQRIFRKFIESEEDEDLQIIMDYLFSIKEIGSETLHINEKETLKTYSFSKNYQATPIYSEDDKLEDLLKKIKKTIEVIPKIDDLTYGKIIDYTFNNPTNKFMISEIKMEYLLSFLNIKRKELKHINEKYEAIKKEMEIKEAKISNIIKNIKYGNNLDKYNKFVKKYEIKDDYNKIISYLNLLANYSIPNFDKTNKKKKNKVDNENDEEDEEEKEEEYEKEINREKTFMLEEENLRNEIDILFKKEPKIIEYIEIYLKNKLNDYVNCKSKQFIDNINQGIKDIKSLRLKYIKLEKIVEAINELKLFTFNFKEHFDNFIEENKDRIKKKKKLLEKNVSEIVEFSFSYFVDKVKAYVGDINEKVEILSEEPDEFIFKLFLYKIGQDFR